MGGVGGLGLIITSNLNLSYVKLSLGWVVTMNRNILKEILFYHSESCKRMDNRELSRFLNMLILGFVLVSKKVNFRRSDLCLP